MGQIRIDGADGKGPMLLDTETGNLKPIKQIPTIDWLLQYDGIRFIRDSEGATMATFDNIRIIEDGKEYEAVGQGNGANEAVKSLGEDIKNEYVIKDGYIWYVDEQLNFNKQDSKE